jgi:ATP-dependent protease HslVU (ClpYQ) peptidase subunit
VKDGRDQEMAGDDLLKFGKTVVVQNMLQLRRAARQQRMTEINE